MKILFYEHIMSETPKEYEIEATTYGEAIERLKLVGTFAIIDSDETLIYPDCKEKEPKSDTLSVKRIPQGGKSGGLIGAIVGAISVVVGIVLIATGYGAAAAPYFISIGVSLMVGGVASMLVPTPNTPKLKEQDALKERYGLSGGRNKIALGSPYPVIFGKHIVNPPIVGNYYTTLSDNNGSGTQYMNVMLCVGYGPLELTNFMIGLNEFARNDSKIMNGFVDITGTYAGAIEIRQDGTYPELYPYKVFEDQINSELEYFDEVITTTKTVRVIKPYGGSTTKTVTEYEYVDNPDNYTNTRVTIRDTTRIHVPIMFQGLYSLNDNGGLNSRSVHVVMRWRKKGETDWTGVIEQTYTAAKNEVLRYYLEHAFTADELADNPTGEWEVIVYRRTPKSTSTRVVDKCYWLSLQSRTNVRTVLESELKKMCVIAVRIEANQSTQGIIDQISCIAQSVLPVYKDGNWDALAPTSNPAAHYLSILRGQHLTRSVKETSIDYQAIQDLYTWCETNDYRCDGIISNKEPTLQIINKVLATCRARFYLKNARYSLVHDIEKQNPIALLSPKNSRNFAASKAFADEVNGVEANFEDETADYKMTTEVIRLHGVEEKENETKQGWDVWGVTRYEQVVKLARYMLACHELRPETFTLTVSIEHFGIPVGSRVLVQHDVLMVGITSGRIVKIDGRRITLDEIIPLQDQTKEYVLKIFKTDSDEIILVPVITEPTASNTFTAKIDFEAKIGDFYAFGELGKPTIDCFVNGKTIGSDLEGTLTLLPYDTGVFDAVNKPIPPYDPKISSRQPYNLDLIGGVIPETESTVQFEDTGAIFFDFGEYSRKEDDTGPFIYNQGDLADIGNSRYTSLDFEDDADIKGNEIHWVSNGTLPFNVDNIFYYNTSVSFWTGPDIKFTTERQTIFSYRDEASNNIFEMYIENSKLFITTQNMVKDVTSTLDGDLVAGRHFVVERSFSQSECYLFIDGSLKDVFDFKILSYNLISEDGFNLISEDDENLISEEYGLIRSDLNRDNKMSFLSDLDGWNQFLGKVRNINIYGRILDEKRVKELYETGMITESVSILTRFLGKFSIAPEAAKIGDKFFYTGNTTTRFLNGRFYVLGFEGWTLQEEK